MLARKKDHSTVKDHTYIVQGEKMVFSRMLQQNIMIVIKRRHTENNTMFPALLFPICNGATNRADFYLDCNNSI